MKCKLNIGKGFRIAAIILVVVVSFYFLHTALFLPSKFNTLTQHRKAVVESGMRITVPASARVVEGYTIPSRDPTHIYILEMKLSENETEETTDHFLRRMLCIEDEDYGSTWLNDALKHDVQLEALGYTFQWGINYIKDPFIKIYYKEADAGKLQVALVYGTS